MQQVFISYKNEDLDFAENVIGRLEKAGFATWVDSKIGAGEEWRTAIDLAIKPVIVPLRQAGEAKLVAGIEASVLPRSLNWSPFPRQANADGGSD